MARNIIRNNPASCSIENGHRVILQPKIARRSFLKLSEAMTTLSGLAMTARMTGKAVDPGKAAAFSGIEDSQNSLHLLRGRLRHPRGGAERGLGAPGNRPGSTRFPQGGIAARGPGRSTWSTVPGG